ncbi:DUF1833 family protein [Achromobacter sp. SD115]|uniref:DUF1833 family protein n=1 Tax=Achromobacter TaxID=222 RepID=UPI001A96A726|nr:MULTISPECIES: DUF1833 family protein [Achromobacter]MBO1012253.1 DUF1833 family protein [Achromobacter sp. SD115]
MARNFSSQAKRNINATSADEPLIELVEIVHRDLAVPARFANDTADIVVEGHLFNACRFDWSIPDDKAGQVSGARLEVDNIGRELTQWLEVSQGGAGAKCRLIMVLRSNPSNLEFDMTMDLTGLSITNYRVSGDLGFKNTLMQSAVTVRYDPTTTPGVF